MYSEISGFSNHQPVIRHSKWVYLHAGIIDAGAQTKIVRPVLVVDGTLGIYNQTNFTTS